MSMSRKDYVAIAAVFKAMHKAKMTTRERSLLYKVTIDLAYVFGHGNSAFNRNKFILAAEGVDE